MTRLISFIAGIVLIIFSVGYSYLFGKTHDSLEVLTIAGIPLIIGLFLSLVPAISYLFRNNKNLTKSVHPAIIWGIWLVLYVTTPLSGNYMFIVGNAARVFFVVGVLSLITYLMNSRKNTN